MKGNRNRVFDIGNVGCLLIRFAKPSRYLFFLAGILMLTSTLLDLFRPYLLKVAIDDAIMQSDMAGLYDIIIVYFASLIGSGIVIYAQTMILQHVGQKIIHQMRERVLKHILSQPYDSLQTKSVGAMLTNVTNDTEAVKELYTGVLVASICDVLIVVGILVTMLMMNWQLAIFVVMMMPVLLWGIRWYKQHSRSVYRVLREKNAQVNIYLQESLQGIAIVKAFSRLKQSEEEFHAVSREYLNAGVREIKVTVLFRPMIDLFAILAVVSVLVMSGTVTRAGGTEIGVIVAFIRYTEKLFFPIKDLAEKYNLLQSALAAAERIYHLLEDESEPHEKRIGERIDKVRSIEFQHVWFAYEGENWVVRDVSFRINEGEFWGIAGKSGAGKTTLIHLLLGFYQPTRGRILLNGRPLDVYDIESVRRSIGLVFQDIHLFKGTIADNITLFRPMEEASVVRAAQTAGIAEMIDRLPRGYRTDIGYDGLSLSSGERQLLSMARVLASDADTLILDEATSHIDSLAEHRLQCALESAAKEHTVLVIAHRLSTIREADGILVMEQGEVREQGTHEELVAKQGIYYDLCKIG